MGPWLTNHTLNLCACFHMAHCAKTPIFLLILSDNEEFISISWETTFWNILRIVLASYLHGVFSGASREIDCRNKGRKVHSGISKVLLTLTLARSRQNPRERKDGSLLIFLVRNLRDARHDDSEPVSETGLQANVQELLGFQLGLFWIPSGSGGFLASIGSKSFVLSYKPWITGWAVHPACRLDAEISPFKQKFLVLY